MLKIVRISSNILIALAILFLGYCYFTKRGIFIPTITHNNEELQIGGDFSLTNHDGQVVHSTIDFKNKYRLTFFGFSSCKRICPMNLGIISEALAKLDSRIHDKLQTIFITIDPEHDHVEKLREFQQQFDSKIQMLTGEKKEIDKVMKNYRVYTNKSDGEIDHSSLIYLIGPDGKYITHFVLDLNSDKSQSDILVNGLKKYIIF